MRSVELYTTKSCPACPAAKANIEKIMPMLRQHGVQVEFLDPFESESANALALARNVQAVPTAVILDGPTEIGRVKSYIQPAAVLSALGL